MSKSIVDLVFVVDASHSMKPCFEALVSHLDKILQPLQDTASSIRYGLVAHAAGAKGGEAVYDHTFLCGSGPDSMAKLYSPQVSDSDFFTTDSGKFKRALSEVKCAGNEEMLIALDVALDFPFGPLDSHKRVIAVFSDEPLEAGLEEGKYNEKISALTEKIHARKVKLFMAMPGGDGMDELSMADKSEMEEVSEGHGLAGVDFSKLLMQMGKSISGSSLQVVHEPDYQTALFGQDKWTSAKGAVLATDRDIVLGIGESALIDMSSPLEWIHAKLNWTASVDLDLHVFFETNSGAKKHVFFSNMNEKDVSLDYDAGIGDEGGDNEENVEIKSLDDVKRMLFATKIFSKGGCFDDYDGRVLVETSNGQTIEVPMSARKRADWCVIAKIENTNPLSPEVMNINKVQEENPDVEAF